MANSKVSDLNQNQKKHSQQPGKDVSKSPGSGDHKTSDQQAKNSQGHQVQAGQQGTDGDRQAKGGSGQHK